MEGLLNMEGRLNMEELLDTLVQDTTYAWTTDRDC